MANVTETSLTANIHEHPCSCCGAPAYSSMVSPHVHPDSPSTVRKYTIELDGICSCQCCCSCFEQEERAASYQNKVMVGYVFYVCQQCCPNLRDDPYGAQLIYRFCVLCRQARCPMCGLDHHDVDNDGIITCDCGHAYDPRNLPLSQCLKIRRAD